MPSFVGLRVVRGPDWKWGDQDGGEGHAGTVIKIKTKSSGAVPILASNLAEINIYEAKMVTQITVLWDSGFKGKYRGGPKGSYDLRVIIIKQFRSLKFYLRELTNSC